MNALPPLGTVRHNLGARIAEVRSSRFLADPFTRVFLVMALVVNGANFLLLVLSVHSTMGPVPTAYSTLDPGYVLGPWYYPYVVALFGLVVTLLNGVLSYRAFVTSRLTSFFLLVGSVVVGAFCLIVSHALGAVR